VAEWYVHSPLRSGIDRRMMPLRLRTGIRDELVLSAVAIMEESIEDHLSWHSLREGWAYPPISSSGSFSSSSISLRMVLPQLEASPRCRFADPLDPYGSAKSPCPAASRIPPVSRELSSSSSDALRVRSGAAIQP
jgi:hypothetical protein